MPVLSVYTAGVPTSGMEIITEAVKQAFGECSIEELGRDNLRYKVRTGSKNTSVALIVLDSASMEECKDIEDGLYKSSKFYNYTDDKKLVEYLNSLYSLSLEVSDETLSASMDSDNSYSVSAYEFEEKKTDLIEKYTSQLNDKDSIIKTLNSHIKELKGIIDECGYSVDDEELESAKNEIIALNSRVSDLLKSVENLESQLKSKDASESALRDSLADLQGKLNKLKSDYNDLNKELSEERVTSSQKSGVIRDKDKEIDKLKKKLIVVEGQVDLSADTERKCKELESSVKSLKLDLSKKDLEIQRLNSDISSTGKANEQIEKYKKLLEESEYKTVELEKQLDSLEGKYSDAIEKNNSLVDELNDYDEKYYDLQRKYDESEAFLAKANSDKIALSEKIRFLEKSANIDESSMDTDLELSELRRKYAELQMNVFNIISAKSLPHSSVKVPMIESGMDRLKNVRFQFSGNTESRKGTYKCMYSEFIGLTHEKFLIVDVTSETAIDYVFQMKTIVDGLQWFATGGGVQNYLSATCLPNVKVLMPKLGYINDSYFLTVNWSRRLQELENSGYKVVVYCGDISNLVGRVLFESFSEIGNTAIYVHGNAIGSRSLIANSNGLSGVKNSIIAFYDFDKNMSKFYEIMSKKAKCSIISYSK